MLIIIPIFSVLFNIIVLYQFLLNYYSLMLISMVSLKFLFPGFKLMCLIFFQVNWPCTIFFS